MRTTLDRTFGDWLAFALRSRDLNNKAATFRRRRDKALLRGTMAQWHKAASLIPLEEVALRQGNRRVLASYMSLWKKRAQQARLADAFHDRTVMKAAMRRIDNVYGKRLSKERMAREIAAARDRETMAEALRTWSLVGRSRLYSRVTDRRRKRNVFDKWLGKMDRVQTLTGELDGPRKS